MQSNIAFGEDLLHFVWQHKAFECQNLQTTNGAKLEILEAGRLNKHAGADFSEAKIYIDGLLWVGDIEMHLRASDWLLHGHSHDIAYERVILHVVFDPDKEIFYPDGRAIPTLSLANLIPKSLIWRYKALIDNENWVPCAAHLPTNLPKETWTNWLEKLAAERLEQRVEAIGQQLDATQNDWNELFYWSLAQALGGEVNAVAMQTLARSLPLLTLLKHKDNRQQIEALLFGQANLLPDETEDKYLLSLKREYDYLRKKYQLRPISAAYWRFARMRPANFPTLRIAQLAQLLYQSQNLFSKVLDTNNLRKAQRFFKLTLHEFWDEHYTLDKKSVVPRQKSLGKSGVDIIFVNAVLPLLYAYGRLRSRSELIDRVLSWAKELPPEDNHLIDSWLSHGVAADNSLETQALLQLYRHHCAPRHCLNCVVGQNLLRKEDEKTN